MHEKKRFAQEKHSLYYCVVHFVEEQKCTLRREPILKYVYFKDYPSYISKKELKPIDNVD